MKFTGIVVKGQKLGRTIGFPTINIEKTSGRFPKKFGIYGCSVRIDGIVYSGAMHFGPRPTINDKNPVCEIHLVHCRKNLYGKTVEVSMKNFLRPIQKFRSLQDLTSAIKNDVVALA